MQVDVWWGLDLYVWNWVSGKCGTETYNNMIAKHILLKKIFSIWFWFRFQHPRKYLKIEPPERTATF